MVTIIFIDAMPFKIIEIIIRGVYSPIFSVLSKNYGEPKIAISIFYCFQKQGLTVVTLLFAAVAGDTAALQRLHLQGVDMAAADYDGRTALHLAAAEGHLQCVIFLLDICGVRPDPADRWPPHMHLNYADRYDNTLHCHGELKKNIFGENIFVRSIFGCESSPISRNLRSLVS